MTSELPFVKMQGVGNDFVVMEGSATTGRDLSALAIALCDRRRGVGADGLLVAEPSNHADLRMRMFNPDGTPDVCGNGLRCIARYARSRILATSDRMTIETLVDVRAAQINRDPEGQFASVTVTMGHPQFAPEAIPMRAPSSERVMDYPLRLPQGETLVLTALSTGSTHAVTFVDELPDDARFFAVSPQVECHPLFPERVSLMWCQPEERGHLRLRIWERGAGETWGCGTGACAAATAAILRGAAAQDEPITVLSRGGALQIVWNESEGLQMTGPAEFVFEGQIRI